MIDPGQITETVVIHEPAPRPRLKLLTWLGVQLRHAEVDRAVAYGLVAMAWQVLSGPLTLLFIAKFLSPVAQGYYYTFASLLALQSYAELGLSVVILNAASHEWAGLQLDAIGRIVGDPRALSRLVSLGRFACRWYAIAALLFFVVVGSVGHQFLSHQLDAGISWTAPWWTLVVLTSLQLWALPFNALLEGCNQVLNVQKFRLSQFVLRTLALWTALFFGGELWAAVAASAVALSRDVYLLGVKYRHFFVPFLSPPAGAVMNWRREILPMQWRMALSGAVGYFYFQLFTPVMFRYHGPVAAGQMGMTLSFISMVQGLSGTWMQPKVPRFGMLIAQRQFGELDRVWWRTTRAVVLIAAAAALAGWTTLAVVTTLGWPIATRLLGLTASGLFLIAGVNMAGLYCMAAYLRAHKREPLLVMSITTALLMGALVWQLGSRFGATGIAAVYLFVTVGVALPWQVAIMMRARQEWHTP